MILAEKDLIDIDKKISYYLPELKKTNKQDLTIRDILAHQSGLIPYYPYWKTTLNGENKKFNYYNTSRTGEHTVELSSGLFAKPALKDTLWSWMLQSELRKKVNNLLPYDYKYSDIGFYLIQRLVEEVTGWPLDIFLEEYLYRPIGARIITYLPKNKFTIEQIVPSEIDQSFRKGLIQGNVHDEIASIYGGVAGHAGVFSNAYDLAIILQMNLQNGYYGGTRYIHPSIVYEFTKRQYESNRRGLGWDKTQKIGDEYNPASYLASDLSYGHSGFTGTYSWVDPEYDLIYIFLSNRTYPDSSNKKLIDLEVRKRIQTVIYSSLIKK
jgi:CubicO group peptidase (beta-lactamase class C family)